MENRLIHQHRLLARLDNLPFSWILLLQPCMSLQLMKAFNRCVVVSTIKRLPSSVPCDAIELRVLLLMLQDHPLIYHQGQRTPRTSTMPSRFKTFKPTHCQLDGSWTRRAIFNWT